MPTKVKPPQPLIDRLRRGRRFLLTSHANPDGDAIGSEVALQRILRALGKSVRIWNRDPTPNLYRGLPGVEAIHCGLVPPEGFPKKYDVVILLECPSVDRTGLEALLTDTEVINIDHHLGNQQYGKINWVDTSSPACGEMIYRLAKDLQITLDPPTATCLYLTLVTDTGGFRFSNTSPSAFAAAAELVSQGARPEQVAQWLYESQPESAVRLLGELLRTLELHHQGQVATVVLQSEMYQRAGATPQDSEGLIDTPRSIEGVLIVALLRQLAHDRWKASLRSRGEIDIESVARRHGGGGHRNAAGCAFAGGLDEVKHLLVAELAAQLPPLTAGADSPALAPTE